MRRIDQWEVIAAVARHVDSTRKKIRGNKVGHRLSAYSIASDLDKLARIARTLHRLYEDACNEPVRACFSCENSTHETSANHKPSTCHYARCERLEKRAETIGTELGIVVTHQRDPRGAPIKLWADKEDGRSLGYFGVGR